MAEKNGWPVPLLSYVQRDAIRSDVVLLEKGAVEDCRTFRLRSLPQRQACTNGSPASEESAATSSWHRNRVLLPGRCVGRHVLFQAVRISLIETHDADLIYCLWCNCETYGGNIRLVYPQILSEERLVPGNRHLDVDLTTRRDQAPFQAFPCPLFASPEDGPMAGLI